MGTEKVACLVNSSSLEDCFIFSRSGQGKRRNRTVRHVPSRDSRAVHAFRLAPSPAPPDSVFGEMIRAHLGPSPCIDARLRAQAARAARSLPQSFLARTFGKNAAARAHVPRGGGRRLCWLAHSADPFAMCKTPFCAFPNRME